MIKVFVTDNKAKNVSAAIISGLKRQVNELNSAEYNYADILRSITVFKEYSRLLSAYFGIEVNISFNIQHSSKAKVNTVNNTVPRVRINDLNAALRSNYNMLIQIVGQIESIYNKAYEGYKSMVSLYDTERLEYADFRDDAISEIDSLTEALNNTEIVTEEEITEAINEAQAETESQIEETEMAVDNTAQEVWDTNKGYETSSQIQEDAMKAAEEYAENNAQAHAAEEAANDLAKAYAEVIATEETMNEARNTAYIALVESTAALIKSEEKDVTARSNELAAIGLVNAGIHSGDLPETVGGLTAGTFLSLSGNQIITVEHNDDGTTTITIEDSDGSHSSRTYSSSDNYESIEETAKDTARQSRAEADEAKANADQKAEEYSKASEAFEVAKAAYDNAAEKALEAQQNYDDASIQYATDDELETGWQNDPDNPSDDDYGEDNWGDWSDIIGEGIEDGGDEDDSEDTED